MPSGVNTIDFYEDFTVTAITDNEVRVQLKATLFEVKADKGAADGYAPLDATAKIPIAYIPTSVIVTDADTLDGYHYSQIASEIDADIAAAVASHTALTTDIHGAAGTDRLALLSDISTSPGGPYEIYISLGAEALTV